MDIPMQKQHDAQTSFAFACIQMWCIGAGLTSLTRCTRSNGVVDIEPGVICLGEIFLDACGLTVSKRLQNFNNSFNKWYEECFWITWFSV